ncbi:hypothetical protein HanIR_Chr15g0732941 [Helianthus annuus]|nr:hypothetical protein HanIR_Chr15g0732941 [Helianthus annuus]
MALLTKIRCLISATLDTLPIGLSGRPNPPLSAEAFILPATIGIGFYSTHRHQRKLLFTTEHFQQTSWSTHASGGGFHATRHSGRFFRSPLPSPADSFLARAISCENRPKSYP